MALLLLGGAPLLLGGTANVETAGGDLGWTTGSDMKANLVSWLSTASAGDTLVIDGLYDLSGGSTITASTDNISIVGLHKNTCGFILTETATSAAVITLDADNILLKNLSFSTTDVEDLTTSYVKTLSTSSNCRIDTCSFDGPLDRFVWILGDHHSINRCRFTDGQFMLSIDKSNGLVVNECYFYRGISAGGKGDGIKYAAYGTNWAENVRVTNCFFDRLYREGIDTASNLNGLDVIGCTFVKDTVGGQKGGMDIKSEYDTYVNKNINVVGCEFVDGGAEVTTVGTLGSDRTKLTHNVTFTACTFRRSDSYTAEVSVGGGGGKSHGVIYDSCHFDRVTVKQMSDGGEYRNCSVVMSSATDQTSGGFHMAVTSDGGRHHFRRVEMNGRGYFIYLQNCADVYIAAETVNGDGDLIRCQDGTQSRVEVGPVWYEGSGTNAGTVIEFGYLTGVASDDFWLHDLTGNNIKCLVEFGGFSGSTDKIRMDRLKTIDATSALIDFNTETPTNLIIDDTQHGGNQYDGTLPGGVTIGSRY